MRIVISVFALLLALPAFAADRPPNFIILLADDLGYADVGFDGRTEWQTPNIDRLAHEGTIFRRWYTAAVVCAPSRAALMTGRYSIHNGVCGNDSLDLPSDELTIAEALKPAGYATALFGKWHHGGARPGQKTYTHPMDQGCDEFFGFTDADLNRETIVIFSSDHGATFEKLAEGTSVYFDSNRPFRGQKRTLWEGGMRVPAVVRWSGHVASHGDSHEVVHNCDVFPTLMAAAGAEVDPKLKIDGTNVLDV